VALISSLKTSFSITTIPGSRGFTRPNWSPSSSTEVFPKSYPHFIQISPSTLHDILISLAEYPGESTREDRQLAAEYLLSVYTPHEGQRMQWIFKEAGFY
jgi:hypothetical protein